jgi:glycosyltransferase involved in cell wall biosynthesis
MRIAQIATLATPVRAVGSASIEAVIWLLTRELCRLGHEVTVFACAGSETSGTLVATLPGPYLQAGSPGDWYLCEWINLCRAVEQSARFDVLHSHAYLWGIPLQPLARAPFVHTLHVAATADAARLWALAPASHVTALTQSQWSCFPDLHPAAVIHHAVAADHFTFQGEPEDYVCYLGRFLPGKGPLEAIAAARALGLRIVLAGPSSEYFERQVKPLVDGRTVEYVGFVTGQMRDQLLRHARALLYPVREAEPFGLVLAEAMMCGTPVAAVRLGAVPELVDEGITGYSVPAMEQLPDAVVRTLALDRRRVRQHAEKRFSAERMARAYVEVYQRAASATHGLDRVKTAQSHP